MQFNECILFRCNFWCINKYHAWLINHRPSSELGIDSTFSSQFETKYFQKSQKKLLCCKNYKFVTISSKNRM